MIYNKSNKLPLKYKRAIHKVLSGYGVSLHYGDMGGDIPRGYNHSLGSNGGSKVYKMISTGALCNDFNLIYNNDKVLGGGGVRYTLDLTNGDISDIAFL